MKEGRQGAYTVMRCDFSPASNRWKTWGQDFHLQRLATSINLLEDSSGCDQLELPISKALETTRLVMDCLQDRIVHDLGPKLTKEKNSSVLTTMLTCLWTLRGKELKVSGHIFSTGVVVDPKSYDPTPGTAVVAKPASATKDPLLPARLGEKVRAKSSSWCRRRRPLEDLFKKDGVSEVLLTQQNGKDILLLEGLTSNLFIGYKDGTLKTPSDRYCLPGYARHLILSCAEEENVKIEVGPISVNDASEWQEVFVTSAIRLIAPINKIVLQQPVSGCAAEVLWECQGSKGGKLWKQMYSRLIS